MRPIRAVMLGVLTTQLGCSMGSSTLGVTPGGSQDIGLTRDIIAMGYVPDQASFTAEGLFSEHDLPLEGPACEQLICPRGAVTEHLPLDGRDSRPLAQVGFATGLDAETFSRRPLDVVGVVDISCSMDGGKLELARDALQAMVDQLDEADRMSLVVFGANARVVRPSRSMTEEQKFRMRSAIEDLSIGGSTALEDGMSRGFGQLAPEPGVESRMMLFTDARPNTGATEQSEFVRMTRAASAEGKHLTLFGTGTDLGVDLADAVGRVRQEELLRDGPPRPVALQHGVTAAEAARATPGRVGDEPFHPASPLGLALGADAVHHGLRVVVAEEDDVDLVGHGFLVRPAPGSPLARPGP